MVSGMDDFQNKCKSLLIDWYKENKERVPAWDEVFVVWSCKTLQNYKCLISTSLPYTIYAEFTYNGNKAELYMDVYTKVTNKVIVLQRGVNND